MARKRYTAEQIIGHLRQAEIRISEGKTVGEVSRELGVSEQTYSPETGKLSGTGMGVRAFFSSGTTSSPTSPGNRADREWAWVPVGRVHLPSSLSEMSWLTIELLQREIMDIL